MLTLHIGVGKTGTTSLQNVYFSGHPELFYLGTAQTPTPEQEAFEKLLPPFLRQDSLAFDPAPLRDHAREVVRRAREAGKAPLYSNEVIIDADMDKGLILQRLYDCFAPCKILLTIREQRSFLRSLYGHDNNKLKGLPAPCNGKFIGIHEWLEYHHDQLGMQRGWMWLGQYHHLARGLVRTFGRENVRILLFEQFKADRTAFLDTLCSFVGVGNPPELDAELGSRRLNVHSADRWLQKQLYMYDLRTRGSWLASHPALLRAAGALYSNLHKDAAPAKIALPEDWEPILHEAFAASNAALAQEFGLPLAESGYLLPA